MRSLSSLLKFAVEGPADLPKPLSGISSPPENTPAANANQATPLNPPLKPQPSTQQTSTPTAFQSLVGFDPAREQQADQLTQQYAGGGMPEHEAGRLARQQAGTWNQTPLYQKQQLMYPGHTPDWYAQPEHQNSLAGMFTRTLGADLSGQGRMLTGTGVTNAAGYVPRALWGAAAATPSLAADGLNMAIGNDRPSYSQSAAKDILEPATQFLEIDPFHGVDSSFQRITRDGQQMQQIGKELQNDPNNHLAMRALGAAARTAGSAGNMAPTATSVAAIPAAGPTLAGGLMQYAPRREFAQAGLDAAGITPYQDAAAEYLDSVANDPNGNIATRSLGAGGANLVREGLPGATKGSLPFLSGQALSAGADRALADVTKRRQSYVGGPTDTPDVRTLNYQQLATQELDLTNITPEKHQQLQEAADQISSKFAELPPEQQGPAATYVTKLRAASYPLQAGESPTELAKRIDAGSPSAADTMRAAGTYAQEHPEATKSPNWLQDFSQGFGKLDPSMQGLLVLGIPMLMGGMLAGVGGGAFAPLLFGLLGAAAVGGMVSGAKPQAGGQTGAAPATATPAVAKGSPLAPFLQDSRIDAAERSQLFKDPTLRQHIMGLPEAEQQQVLGAALSGDQDFATQLGQAAKAQSALQGGYGWMIPSEHNIHSLDDLYGKFKPHGLDPTQAQRMLELYNRR